MRMSFIADGAGQQDFTNAEKYREQQAGCLGKAELFEQTL